MKLDLSKLQNVRHLSGGKTTAQCPACAADGGDAKKEHFVIFADGKFGCVVHHKDKEHNKAILKLAGTNGRGDGGFGGRLTVKPMQVEESRVLMKVGQLGRVKPTLEKSEHRSSTADLPPERPEVGAARPPRPAPTPPPVTVNDITPEITDEELRAFLDSPAVVV